MIYSVSGKLTEKEENLAVIECAGVGYACRTTQTTLSQIGEIGEEVKLYTWLSVREDAMELFGFATKSELNCFRMLLTVSGIGAKAGLSILSNMNANQFALLVSSGDSTALTKVKGIGKKSAERIVVDLKDKLTKNTPALQASVVLPANSKDNLSEALGALLVLGYRQEEVMPFLLKQPETVSPEELIKLTLQEIGRQA